MKKEKEKEGKFDKGKNIVFRGEEENLEKENIWSVNEEE